MTGVSLIRIGELASRTGVSTHVLRVWEERYAVLRPERSAGGYRLYGPDDEARVREMVRLRDAGASAAEAAAYLLATSGPVVQPIALDVCLARLAAGFAAYDLTEVRAALDAAVAGHPTDQVLREVCFPYLRWLGDEWEAGRVTIAQEHHASGTIRSWLTGLDAVAAEPVPEQPAAVLACTPHERHDIGLLGLDLVLRQAGWRVVFLGADTPMEESVRTTGETGADVLVLAGTEPHMYRAHLEQHAGTLRDLGPAVRVAIGGPAADAAVAERIGALLLAPDPALAAAQLSEPGGATYEPVTDVGSPALPGPSRSLTGRS